MTKLDRFKQVSKIVVGVSVSFTVANVIANNTNAFKPHHKVEAYIGGAVLGMMVAGSAEKYIGDFIDTIATAVTEAKSEA